MDVMRWLGAITGACFAVCAAAGGVALLIYVATEQWDKFVGRLVKAECKLARCKLGSSLIDASHFMSEDRSAKMLLWVVGRQIQEEGCFDTDQVRYEWRRRMNEIRNEIKTIMPAEKLTMSHVPVQPYFEIGEKVKVRGVFGECTVEIIDSGICEQGRWYEVKYEDNKSLHVSEGYLAQWNTPKENKA